MSSMRSFACKNHSEFLSWWVVEFGFTFSVKISLTGCCVFLTRNKTNKSCSYFVNTQFLAKLVPYFFSFFWGIPWMFQACSLRSGFVKHSMFVVWIPAGFEVSFSSSNITFTVSMSDRCFNPHLSGRVPVFHHFVLRYRLFRGRCFDCRGG